MDNQESIKQEVIFSEHWVSRSRKILNVCLLSLVWIPISSAMLLGFSLDSDVQITSDQVRHDNSQEINLIIQEPSSDELAALIDGIITSQRREHNLSGVTVSVIMNDSLIFARGYGLADADSNRAVQADQTLFRIGSVSKTFTWTAVMMLAEQGMLDLDEDVNTYLKNVEVAEAFDEPVTMRHLMSHRAGFESSIVLFSVADDDPRTLSELLSDHQPKRVNPPGFRTSYSNWGAALAAQVVEDVAGMPYKTYLQDEILTPLGMNNTVTDLPAEMSDERQRFLATGYKVNQGAIDLQNYMQLGQYWPAGGMASTATDMERWMQFHLNGGQLDTVRLMRPETHTQMWTRAYNDRPHGADVAHGFQDVYYRGIRVLGHGGGTAAFLTNMVMVPELNLGVFTSQNGSYGFSQIRQLGAFIVDILINESNQPLSYETGSTEGTLELEGAYLNNRRVFSTFAAVLALGGESTVAPVSDSSFVLSGGGTQTYFKKMKAYDDMYEDAEGTRISVIRDDKGNVAAIADGSGVHTLERIGFMSMYSTMLGSFVLVLLLSFTSLIGTWRRFRKNENQGGKTKFAAAIRFLAALAVLTFTAAVVYMLIESSNIDSSSIAGNYPILSMTLTHYAGWFVAIMSLIAIAGLWPVWSGEGWKIIGRLHYSLYALSLLFFSILLWQWRVIGAAVV